MPITKNPDIRQFGPGTLTPTEVAVIAEAVGIAQGDIAVMVGIACAESSLNPRAKNNIPCYGLWQINMRGDLGKNRLKQFQIESADELYNPIQNAAAAKLILEGSGGRGNWTTYTGADTPNHEKTYQKYMEVAQGAYGRTGTLTKAQKDAILKSAKDEYLKNHSNDTDNPSQGKELLDKVGGVAKDAASSVTSSFGQWSGVVSGIAANAGVLAIAALLITLGVVILLRTTVISAATGGVVKAVKKGLA